MGDTITELDVRLFTTLARFDAVYHGHFKCNRHKLTEMPVLWAYARDLFQTPGFGDTVDFVQIKQHYYLVHTDINPTQIVPRGPDLSGWLIPHSREQLGGRPFGDGTPPPPAEAAEQVPAGHRPHATACETIDGYGVDGYGAEGPRNLTERGQCIDESGSSETEKLLMAVAGMVARDRLARGVKLNYPESVAVLSNWVIERAREGALVEDLMSSGREVLGRADVMDGVAEMITDVQVEATFPDGRKLVTLHQPIQ